MNSTLVRNGKGGVKKREQMGSNVGTYTRSPELWTKLHNSEGGGLGTESENGTNVPPFRTYVRSNIPTIVGTPPHSLEEIDICSMYISMVALLDPSDCRNVHTFVFVGSCRQVQSGTDEVQSNTTTTSNRRGNRWRQGVARSSLTIGITPTRLLVMRSDSPPNQKLAELLLGRPVSEYVAEKREARPQWPWKLIAEQLAMDTNGRVAVAGETLRLWYGERAGDEDTAKAHALIGAASSIARKVHLDGAATRSDVSHAMGSGKRRKLVSLDEALDYALAEGWILVDDTGRHVPGESPPAR